ncbi:MAG: hypothetical protein H6660_15500 [Ardenticatenaceae bacterium]|nr:hypothetical protein [Ardenticatenaceae bacterium]
MSIDWFAILTLSICGLDKGVRLPASGSSTSRQRLFDFLPAALHLPASGFCLCHKRLVPLPQAAVDFATSCG